MDAAQVAVIVLNWNGKQDTLECLASLEAVTHPRCRVIMVDNGSSDGSVEAVQEAFPQTIILRNGRNLGYAGGNNVGIRYALAQGYEYITILNNDTLVSPDFLHILVEHYRRLPGPAVLSPMIYYHADPARIWYAGAEWTGWGFRRLLNKEEDSSKKLNGLTPTDFTVGCCLLTSREVFRKVGYFDERFFLCFEEIEWCFRARRSGIYSYIAPQAKIWHKVSVSFGGDRSPLLYYFNSRNSLLWAEMHLPREEYIRFLGYRLRSLKKSIVPPWHLLENGAPLPKRLFWSCRTYAKTVKRNLSKPAVRAELLGLVHYFCRRFGSAPSSVMNS